MTTYRTCCRLLLFLVLLIPIPLSAQQRWEPVNNGLEGGWIFQFGFTPGGAVVAHSDATLYRLVDGNRWEMVRYGVTSVSFATAADGTILMSASDGLYRSTDGGEEWTMLRGPFGSYTPVTVASDGTLYVARPDGLLRSTDNGVTWIDRTNAGFSDPNRRIIAGNDGRIFTVSRGVLYRSIDKGDSWESVASFAGYIRFALERPSGVLLVDADPGLWVSHDSGQTWQRHDSLSRRMMWNAPDGVLYSTQPSPNPRFRQAIYRSTNDAESWELVDSNAPGTFDITADGTFWKSSEFDHTYRSTDTGKTWERITKGMQEIPIAGPVRVHEDELFVLRHSGRYPVGPAHTDHHDLFRSTDNGSSWERRARSLSNRMTVDRHGRVYAERVEYEASLLRLTIRPSVSYDKGGTWQDLCPDSVVGCTSSRAGFVTGWIARGDKSELHISTDGATTWRIHTLPRPVRSIHVTDDGMLLAGLFGQGGNDPLDGLYRSLDSGTTWELVRPGMEIRGIVRDAEGSLHMFGVDWKVDSSKRIYRSTDNGLTWSQTYPYPFGELTDLFLVSPQGIIIPTSSTYTGWPWVISKDFGRTWSPMPSAPLDSRYAGQVAVGGSGALYTFSHSPETATYRSTDAGETWIRSSDGILPGTHITSIVETPWGDLFLGSSTRGVYRMNGQPSAVPGHAASSGSLSFTVVPQPVSGTGRISIDLPRHAHIRLTLHDMLGETVALLHDEEHEEGTITLDLETSALAGGFYIVRLTAGGETVSRVLVVR